jgi:hypothetical protein
MLAFTSLLFSNVAQKTKVYSFIAYKFVPVNTLYDKATGLGENK